MNTITFGTKNSYTDWGIILKPKTRPKPAPKYNYVSIPGRSGNLDLTEALGEVQYEDLIYSLEFNVIDAMNTWDEKLRTITNYLQGQKMKVTFSDDPNYYYYGRIKVNALSSDRALGLLSLECNFEPYKYKQNETNDFYTYKGVALTDINGNAVKLRKINDDVKDSIVYYNSKWCIAKNVGEITYSGDGTINIQNNYSTDDRACFNTTYGLFPGVGTSTETIQNLDMKNTRFKIISRVWDPGTDETGSCIQVNTSGARLFIKIERYIANTVAELKTFLAANSVKIQYKLDDTNYVELSSDIQTMLADLDTTYTIDGYSIQDGTPEPLNPIPIYSFGDLGVIMLVSDEISDSLLISNDYKEVIPTIKLSSSATLKYGNTSTSLSAGTYKLNDFILKEGNTPIALIGDGTVNFKYWEGAL